MRENSSGVVHILLILMIVAIVGVVVFGKNKLNSVIQIGSPVSTSDINDSAPAAILKRTPTSSPLQVEYEYSVEAHEFKLKYFSRNDKFFEERSYPDEVKSITDDSLTPIDCSKRYVNGADEGLYLYFAPESGFNEPLKLNDRVLLSYINIINNHYKNRQTKDKEVSEFLSCTSREDKKIVLYSLGPCGGGCDGIPYVGLINGNELQEIGKLDVRYAYSGCRKPLQLTTDSVFYFECSGGEMGFGAKIYKADLNNLAISQIVECVSQYSEEGGKFSTSCI